MIATITLVKDFLFSGWFSAGDGDGLGGFVPVNLMAVAVGRDHAYT